jgi:flagellar motor switch protein FliN/FliY
MTRSTSNTAASATQHIELPELEPRSASGPSLLSSGSDLLNSIAIDVTVVVGQAHTTVGQLMRLKESDILKIDRGVDQPVDINVNGNIVARGQLVVVDDCFGVRVTEVALAAKAGA